jgi:hypothetical protein
MDQSIDNRQLEIGNVKTHPLSRTVLTSCRYKMAVLFAVDGCVNLLSARELPVLPEKNHPTKVFRRLDIEALSNSGVAGQRALRRSGRWA